MQTKKIFIEGMHCKSCELLVKEQLLQISSIKNVQLNFPTNLATVTYTSEKLPLETINKILSKFGYNATDNLQAIQACSLSPRGDWKQWLKSAIIVLVFFAGFKLITSSLNFGISFNNSSISWIMAFIIGITASVSTCFAIVGSIVVAFNSTRNISGFSGIKEAFLPNLVFHLGRVATFTALGAVLGAIGGSLQISETLIFVFSIITAIIMFWLGLFILGLVPPLSRLPFFGSLINEKILSRLKYSGGKLSPFLLGGITFFLPCGFTQSMQIYALTSGSALQGAIILASFALGSAPFLIMVGAGHSWLRMKNFISFQRAMGLLILIFSFYTLQSGLLIGKKPFSSQADNFPIEKKSTSAFVSPPYEKEQLIEMKITPSGFEPRKFSLKKGIPVKWVINGTQASGCTNKIVVPDLKISKEITSGENIITFTPNESGKIAFSCWMGMVRGEFLVN